jgi:hypothetical protein
MFSNNWCESVNFIHFGYGAERLKIILALLQPRNTKCELRDCIQRQGQVDREVDEIIQGYGSPYRPALNWELLLKDLQETNAYKEYFRNLGVRGFSFQACEDFDFSWPLRSSINFKLALMARRELFYPVRVHKYLPRFAWSHSREDKYPAIAFALGKIINDEMFIFVLQSDLVFQGPAYIREHFRGWRKVLFREVIRYAEGRASRVYLNTSDNVFRTCHPGYHPPKVVPPIWKAIYEGTAKYFGMTRKKVDRRHNIQVLTDVQCRYANEFHYLELSNDSTWNKGVKSYEGYESK